MKRLIVFLGLICVIGCGPGPGDPDAPVPDPPSSDANEVLEETAPEIIQ